MKEEGERRKEEGERRKEKGERRKEEGESLPDESRRVQAGRKDVWEFTKGWDHG